MNISDKGIKLIKQFEGLRLDSYLCPAGVWTIGYGHTGSVHRGMRISPSEADQLLRDDLALFESGVEDMAGECTQGQFDALVSFAFNLGLRSLKNSTLLKLHKAGQHKEAAAQFARWSMAAGKRLPGLVRRRESEAEMYLEMV